MAGWIQKKANGRWIARYRVGGGKTRSSTWDRKVDAEKWLRAELRSRDRGRWVDPALGKTTLGDWAEVAIGARLDNRRSTRARDRSVLDSLVLPVFGGWELRKITPSDVQSWVTGLAGAGKAPNTVRKAYQLLAATLDAAVDSDLLARSPARGIRLPRVERSEMRFLTSDELADLLGAIPARYQVLVRTAAYTGLRFGELAGLRRGDVDPLRRRLRVERSLSEVRGKVMVEDPKTAASRRAVALPSWLAEELAETLAASDRGAVFTSPAGGPLRRGNFRTRVWLPAVAEAGLKGLRFHDLRHTHVAMLIAAREHPKVIQSRLGHASIRTTLDVYGHLMDGLDEAAAEALAPPTAHGARTEVVRLPS